MDLIVEGRGVFLGKHQGRLRVSLNGKTVREAPIMHLQQVVIVANGVAVSSDVFHICAEEGIPIHFIDGLDRPSASVYSAGLTGTVLTRRAQLTAYTDQRGIHVAKAFVHGKLENQRNLLRYMAKNRKETAPEIFTDLTERAQLVADHQDELARVKGERIDEVREIILSIEGRAASIYWKAVRLLIPEEMAWPGRETRGATDSFNMMLNYGYGVLYSQVERSLVLAGLDPYGGFLHADRPGRVSLVMDLIEEFRQPVVDRTMIGLVTRGMELARDEDGRIESATRKRIAEKILERMESSEPYEGKRQPIRCILQSQARHLATYVRGEREAYEPFLAGW